MNELEGLKTTKVANQHFIDINGKRYDAKTGKALPAHETVTKNDKSYVKPVAASGTAVDGFAKRRAEHHAKLAPSVHKKSEKSSTLMRSAVKKPQPAKPKSQDIATIKRRPAPNIIVDPKREARSKKIPQSGLVSRFGRPNSVKPMTAVLPVQPEPEAPPLPILSEHHNLFGKKMSNKDFQAAINNAKSHTQPKHNAAKTTRVSRRLHLTKRSLNIAAASLAAVLLLGFVAYQNVPNLSMRIATSRAGVQGHLPGYQPSGFGMSGPIKYETGKITITYKSHSDEREFKVNQQTSQWDSDGLRESYVASKQQPFQTYQDNGKTIYIYDNDNATWVDGGVWYQIEGNSSLNSDQLLRMAASL